MTKDPSIFITFPLLKDPAVKFVAWTTTPWTLPSNLAIAINPTFTYVKLKDIKQDDIYIVAECRLAALYPKKEEYELIEKMKGADLAGLEYVPLFDYFEKERRKDGCFKVLLGDFVSEADGTGVVHIAPAFGEEDYYLSLENKIIKPDDPLCPIDDNGYFLESVTDFKN